MFGSEATVAKTAKPKTSELLAGMGIQPAVVSMIMKANRVGASHEEVDLILAKVNKEIGGYGIEPITGRWVDGYYQDIVLLYVNMGDPYALTVIYDTRRGRFYPACWGDWVELHERDISSGR